MTYLPVCPLSSYGGIEPPDPIQDQDFPAEQATTMRDGHTGALTRVRFLFFAFTTLSYHEAGVGQGKGTGAASVARDLTAGDLHRFSASSLKLRIRMPTVYGWNRVTPECSGDHPDSQHCWQPPNPL